jgi:IS30 family transposase
MGKRYSQLDLDERIDLSCLRDAGYSLRKIGRLMNRSHTTVSRELKCNSLPKVGFKPVRADIMAQGRYDRPCKLQRLSALREHAHDRLAMGWSPEQIAGRFR